MSKAKNRKRKAETRSSPELRSHPAVRNYTLFCLSALFLIVVCLADRGLAWWCLVPALIGCLALLTHWDYGPPLVLLSLAGLLGFSGPLRYRSPPPGGWSRFPTASLMDLGLCIAVLAYVLGHYRLLSLTRYIFPPRLGRPRVEATQRRSADLVTGRETTFLGLALPLWAGLAVLVWGWVTEEAAPRNAPLEWWPVLRLVWAILAVLAVAGVTASYLRQTTATPEEGLLYLQDQCWRLMRREQGLLNRWLTWARLRAQRKQRFSGPSLETRRQS
jgi:hypothetical protein